MDRRKVTHSETDTLSISGCSSRPTSKLYMSKNTYLPGSQCLCFRCENLNLPILFRSSVGASSFSNYIPISITVIRLYEDLCKSIDSYPLSLYVQLLKVQNIRSGWSLHLLCFDTCTWTLRGLWHTFQNNRLVS